MTRDEINSALKNNATQQIVWFWNLRTAILNPQCGEDYVEECQTMLDWLELEQYDLETMLEGMGMGNDE